MKFIQTKMMNAGMFQKNKFFHKHISNILKCLFVKSVFKNMQSSIFQNIGIILLLVI